MASSVDLTAAQLEQVISYVRQGMVYHPIYWVIKTAGVSQKVAEDYVSALIRDLDKENRRYK